MPVFDFTEIPELRPNGQRRSFDFSTIEGLAEGQQTLSPLTRPTVDLSGLTSAAVGTTAVETTAVAPGPIAGDSSSATVAPRGVLDQAAREFVAGGIGSVAALSGGALIESFAIQAEAQEQAFNATQDIADAKLRTEAQIRLWEEDFKPDADPNQALGDVAVDVAGKVLGFAPELAAKSVVAVLGPSRARELAANSRNVIHDIQTGIRGGLSSQETEELAETIKRLENPRNAVDAPVLSGPRTGDDGVPIVGGDIFVKRTPEEVQADQRRVVELMRKSEEGLPEVLTSKWRRSANWWDKASSADWWILNGAQQAGNIAAFLLSMRTGQRALTGQHAQKVFNSQQLKTLGVVGPAGLGSLTSGYLEAAGYFDQRMNEGVDPLQAATETVQVFESASAITFATSGIGQSIPGVVRSRVARTAGVGSEVVEETLQAIDQNRRSGRPIFEGVDDAILLSFPVGFLGVRTMRGEVSRAQREVFEQQQALIQRALGPLTEGAPEHKRRQIAEVARQREEFEQRVDEMRRGIREEDHEAALEEMDEFQRLRDAEQRQVDEALGDDRAVLDGFESAIQRLINERDGMTAGTAVRRRHPETGKTIIVGRKEGTQAQRVTDPNEIVRINTEIAEIERQRRDFINDLGSFGHQGWAEPHVTTRQDFDLRMQRKMEDATGVDWSREGGQIDADRLGAPTLQERRQEEAEALSHIARREAEVAAYRHLFSLERGSDYHIALMRNAVDLGLLDSSQAVQMTAERLEKLIAGSRIKVPGSTLGAGVVSGGLEAGVDVRDVPDVRPGSGLGQAQGETRRRARQADLEVAFEEKDREVQKQRNVRQRQVDIYQRRSREFREAELIDAFGADDSPQFKGLPIQREGMVAHVTEEGVVLSGAPVTGTAQTDQERRAQREAGLSSIFPEMPVDVSDVNDVDGVRDFFLANENANLAQLPKAELVRLADIAEVDLAISEKTGKTRMSRSQIVKKVDDAIRKGLLQESRDSAQKLREKRAAIERPMPEGAELPPATARIVAEYESNSVDVLASKTKREILDDIDSMITQGVFSESDVEVRRRADDDLLDSRLSKTKLVEAVLSTLMFAPSRGGLTGSRVKLGGMMRSSEERQAELDRRENLEQMTKAQLVNLALEEGVENSRVTSTGGRAQLTKAELVENLLKGPAEAPSEAVTPSLPVVAPKQATRGTSARLVSNKDAESGDRGASFVGKSSGTYSVEDDAGNPIGSIEQVPGREPKSGRKMEMWSGNVGDVYITRQNFADIRSLLRENTVEKLRELAETGSDPGIRILGAGAVTPSLPVVAPKQATRGTSDPAVSPDVVNQIRKIGKGGVTQGMLLKGLLDMGAMEAVAAIRDVGKASGVAITEEFEAAAQEMAQLAGGATAEVSPAQIQSEEAAHVQALFQKITEADTEKEVTELSKSLLDLEILDFIERFNALPGDHSVQLNGLEARVLARQNEPTGDVDAPMSSVDVDELVSDTSNINDLKEFLAEHDVTSIRSAAEELGIAVKTAKGNNRSFDTLVNQVADKVMDRRKGEQVRARAAKKKTAPEEFVENLPKLSNSPTRTMEVGNNRFLSSGKLPSGETVWWTHDEMYEDVNHVPADEAQDIEREHDRGNLGVDVDYLLGLSDKEFEAAFDRIHILWGQKLSEQMGIAQMTERGNERKSRTVVKDLRKELLAQREAKVPDLKPPPQDVTLEHILDEPTRAATLLWGLGLGDTVNGITGRVNDLASGAVHRTGDPAANHAEAGRSLESLRSLIGVGDARTLGRAVRAEAERNRQAGTTPAEAMSTLRGAMKKFAEAHRVVAPINRITRMTRDLGIAFGEMRFKDADVMLRGLENLHRKGLQEWTDAVGEVDSHAALPDNQDVVMQNERLGEDAVAELETLMGQLEAMQDAGVPPSSPERKALADRMREIYGTLPISGASGGQRQTFGQVLREHFMDEKLGFLPRNTLVDLWKAIGDAIAGDSIDAERSPSRARMRGTMKESLETERALTESVARAMDPDTFSRQMIEEFDTPSFNTLFTDPILTLKQVKNNWFIHTANNLFALDFLSRHVNNIRIAEGKEELTTSRDPSKRARLARGAPGRAEVLAEAWGRAVRSAGASRSGLTNAEIADFRDYVFSLSIIRREAGAHERFNRFQALRLDLARVDRDIRSAKGQLSSLAARGRKAKKAETKVRLREERQEYRELHSDFKADRRRISQQLRDLRERLVDTDIFDPTTINPDGHTANSAQSTIDELKRDLGSEAFSRFENAADKVNDVWRDLLEYAADAGLISTQDYLNIMDAQEHNGDYMGPFRVISKWANGGMEDIHSASLSVMGQDVFKHERGTTELVGDMMTASVDRIFKTVGFGESNRAVRELANLRNAADAPEAVKDVIRIPSLGGLDIVDKGTGKEQRFFLVNQEGSVIANQPKAGYKSIEGAENRREKEASREGVGLEPPPGFESIYYMDEGKSHRLWVAKPVADAVKGMNKVQANFLLRMMNHGNQALRLGATAANATFTVVNVPRDLATQYLAADNPLRWYDPRDWWILAESFCQMFTPMGLRTKNTQELIDAWKTHGGSFSSRIAQIKPHRRAVEMIGSPTTRLTTLDKPSDVASVLFSPMMAVIKGLTRFAEAAEGGTRLGLFKKELHAGGAERKGLLGMGTTVRGVSQEDFARAALVSREGTIDFAQGGKVFQCLNLLAPFINAGAQGSRVMINGARNHPWRAATFAAIGLGITVKLLTDDYEEYGPEIVNKIDARMRKKNFIKITGTYEDPESGEILPHYAAWPKGDYIALIAAPVESFIADGYSNRQKSWGPRLSGVLLSTASDISPIEFEREGRFDPALALSSLVPAPAKGTIEVGINRNFYFNKEIEFPRERRLHKKLRYRANTSTGARKLSEWLHYVWGEESHLTLSPIQLDHLASSYAAALGRGVLHAFPRDEDQTDVGWRTRTTLLGTGAEKAENVTWDLPVVGEAIGALGVKDEQIVAFSRLPAVRAFFSTRNREKDNLLFDAYERGSRHAHSKDFLATQEVRSLLEDVRAGKINSATLENFLDGFSARQADIIRAEVGHILDPGKRSSRLAKYRTLGNMGTGNMERAFSIATAFRDVVRTKDERAAYMLELIKTGVADAEVLGQLIALAREGYWDGAPGLWDMADESKYKPPGGSSSK